jgi:hypothetical protein
LTTEQVKKCRDSCRKADGDPLDLAQQPTLQRAKSGCR